LDQGARDAAVRTLAKDGDPDRYAAALFVSQPARRHLLALYAFNVELARVGERLSEPQLGEIRLEWWRDALDRASAGEATGHPIADALGNTASACGLPQADLLALVDARHFDISVKIMPDAEALDDYLDKTAGTLFRLAAAIVGGTSEGTDTVARAAGVAYGLTGLMRALPIHLGRGRVDLPEDALRRHGTAPGDLLAGKMGGGLFATLAELRQRARTALHQASREVAALPAKARGAFLPLALVEPNLSALDKQRDPLREVAGINPLYRLWRLGTHRFG
jgi:phytoene synthase